MDIKILNQTQEQIDIRNLACAIERIMYELKESNGLSFNVEHSIVREIISRYSNTKGVI